MTGFTSRIATPITEWLAVLPRLNARLLAEPPARVADLACSEGRGPLDLIRSYPLVHVDAWDADDGHIARARRAAVAADVDDRLCFEVGRPGDDAVGRYDLVTASATAHCADPTVLALAHGLLVADGVAVLADPSPMSAVMAAGLAAGFGRVRRLPLNWDVGGLYLLDG